MTDPKTKCSTCGRQIRQATADRNSGLCAICKRDSDIAQREKVPVAGPMPQDLPDGLDVEIVVPHWADADSVDWQQVQETLVFLVTEYIRAFAAHHPDERFYGLAFDCNADYCQVFVCLNTEEDLARQAAMYRKQTPNLYADKTDVQIQDQLRWALGDWKYQACTTDGFNDAWEPVETALMNIVPWDDEDNLSQEQFADSFMQTACRAMVRLEATSCFAPLSRTNNFATFVADHDELDEESWKRLELARQAAKS